MANILTLGQGNWTIPNLITGSRLVLVLPTLWLLQAENFVVAYPLLLWLFLSDFLDGRLARRLQQQSYLGTILDPVADKFVAMSLFLWLFQAEIAPGWYVLLVIIRDISQLLSIPILLLWLRISFKVKPAPIAQWGTALNFGLLVLFLAQVPQAEPWPWLVWFSWPLLIISAVLELIILVTYIPRFFQILRGTHDTFE